MAATRDKTCDLIEQSRPQPARALAATPHARAMECHLHVARAATDVLLDMGALISYVSVTPERVRIRLERRPNVGVLEPHSREQYSYYESSQWIACLNWRGVLIEWPDGRLALAHRVAS